MSLGGLRWLVVVWLWCVGGLGAAAGATAPEQHVCTPRVLKATAARENLQQTAAAASLQEGAGRPAAGWMAVTLPDTWTDRWPGHDGAVWYRIDWERGCAAGTAPAAAAALPVALGLDGMNMAGEVFQWRFVVARRRLGGAAFAQLEYAALVGVAGVVLA